MVELDMSADVNVGDLLQEGVDGLAKSRACWIGRPCGVLLP